MNDQDKIDRRRLRTNLITVKRLVEAIAEPIELGQWDTILNVADELVERTMRLQRQAIRSQAVRSAEAIGVDPSEYEESPDTGPEDEPLGPGDPIVEALDFGDE